MKQRLSCIIAFDGLGTHWECELLGSSVPLTETRENEIRQLLVGRLNDFSKAYSRFDALSLVGRLNAESKLENPSTEMLEMMRFAKTMHDATDGIFNISVGGALVQSGYGKVGRPAKVQADFWEHVVLNNEQIRIPAGTTIDFGGFGKGWLIDLFAVILRTNGVSEFIINGGGDMFVSSKVPVPITLEHPTNANVSIGKTAIQEGALAVSSTKKRAWLHEGVEKHHVIDPRNGQPSSGEIVGAYVKASSALIADVMATVLIVKPELEKELVETFRLKTILASA